MAGLLLDCPVHGIVQDPQGVSISGNVEGAVFEGSMGACPICGRISPYIDGTYRSQSGQVSATLRPTPAQLQKLITAAQWAQREVQASPEKAPRVAQQLRDTVAREAPKILKVVDAATSQRSVGIAAWISVIIAIIAMFTSNQQHSLTEEDVVRIIQEIEHEQQGSDQPQAPKVDEKTRPPRGNETDPSGR